MKKIKVGDVFVNSFGAIIVITEPTKAGEPQYYIAPSSEKYAKGFFECRGTSNEESLKEMLEQNGYYKINNMKQENDFEDYEEFKLEYLEEVK